MDCDLKNKTRTELAELIRQFEAKRYLAEYIFSFIHAKDTADIADITPLSKTLRARLVQAGCYISALTLIDRLYDPDGTVKYVFTCPDAVRIESVLMPTENRTTLCISSQAGCRMACALCATGRLKFARNLTAAEIADQVNLAARDCGRITNIVYMGMGEPLDNFDNVIRSVEILNDPAGKNIGNRHITISTCGLPDRIRQLARLGRQVRLAVSLNAAEDDLRRRIMSGAAARANLKDLLAAVKYYQQQTHRRVTFEYCLIKDLNDADAHARKLAALLGDVKCNVNLIEFNPHPGCDFTGSDKQRIRSFAGVLRDAGIETAIRYRRGRSIKAACGQLGATATTNHAE